MEPDQTSGENSSKRPADHSRELPPQDTAASVPGPQLPEQHLKRTKKQVVMTELKEVLTMVIYLAASLSILETYRSLLLLQLGMDEFVHNYTIAIVEAIALGKIVALAQKLPFLQAFRNRALVWAVLYQSVVMTAVVALGGQLEDHLMPASAKLLAQSGNPVALAVTRQLASLLIFVVLFTVRGADKALGSGTLWKLFFEEPHSKK